MLFPLIPKPFWFLFKWVGFKKSDAGSAFKYF